MLSFVYEFSFIIIFICTTYKKGKKHVGNDWNMKV